MNKWKGITTRIVITVLVVVIVIAAAIVSVMTYFMSSLTDTIMLNIMQPMAKTAAQSIEGNLHVMAENLFMIGDNGILTSPNTSAQEKQAVLDTAESGIEFVWLGLYELGGTLLTGSEGCPRSISGRKLNSLMQQTGTLAIENTSVGNSGLEIVLGIPVGAENAGGYYLVGSYKYDVLNDVLGNIHIGAGGTAFIINSEGTLIAHKNLGKVYGRESVDDILGQGDQARSVISLMETRQTGSASVMVQSQRVYVSYAPVRGTLWSLCIEAPRDDFIAAVNQAIAASLITTILVLLACVWVFHLILSNILTEPLHAITQNASLLAEGQFENRLDVGLTRRDDEIGQLGSAFATMSDAVKNVIGDIRQLTFNARAGALNTRAVALDHQGDFKLIIAGINATLDVICSHLDAMPSAFALLNEQRQPIFLNSAMYDMLKRHSYYVKEQSLLNSLLSLDDLDSPHQQAVCIFGEEGQNGDTYDADVALTGNDGNEYSYSLTLRRISSAPNSPMAGGQEVSCVMLILNDVTMLTRAKIEAEAANRAKSNFLSNMSHEMRTPMNAIIGMTSIAKTTEELERKDYCLGKIQDASTHLLGVINDILDMSKIEANKFELSYEEFDFEKMLQKVVNVVNFRVDEKQQDFAVHIDSAIPPRIVSDEQRFAQVITNLLSNAVKFTPEGGSIRLNARLVKEERGVCTIQVEVADTGIGISMEQQSKLFTSFVQAESSTSRKFGGTGLGLAISKNIVEMMGGRVWLESTLGQGSIFAFTAMARRGSLPTVQLPKSGAGWDRLSVLAVDSSLHVRQYFTELMRRLDIRCQVVADGASAADLIESQGSFDIYFVDGKLPDMDSGELTRYIKQHCGDKPVVIMLSSTEWNEIEQKAKQAGADKFLAKPLFPSALAECIDECLNIGKDLNQQDEQGDAGCFAGYHLLLAEDVEINREIVQACLEPTQLTIEVAENGLEALNMFSAQPDKYDVIFMDVQMPEMDGFEATRRIRALEDTHAQKVAIIAMTANVFREDIEKCLASGMNDHLGKPLDFEEVKNKLGKYLPRKTPAE